MNAAQNKNATPTKIYCNILIEKKVGLKMENKNNLQNVKTPTRGVGYLNSINFY